jgi:hypothetical protein
MATQPAPSNMNITAVALRSFPRGSRHARLCHHRYHALPRTAVSYDALLAEIGGKRTMEQRAQRPLTP